MVQLTTNDGFQNIKITLHGQWFEWQFYPLSKLHMLSENVDGEHSNPTKLLFGARTQDDRVC